MASGRALTAPSTAPTAPCKAGPSTIEPIVPIVAPLVAQDTPSVIQGVLTTEQTMQTLQSTQGYGTLTAPTPPTALTQPTPPTALTAPLSYAAAPLPYAPLPTMSARPQVIPMGYYGQGSQFPFMPNPNWMLIEREQMLQQQLLQERQQFEVWRASQAQPSQVQTQPQPPISSSGPLKAEEDVVFIGRSASAKWPRPEDQASNSVKRARSISTSRKPPSPKRDYPRGTCTATRPSQASPTRAEHSAPAQDFEAFKADVTSMMTEMFNKFASKINTSSGGQKDSTPAQAAQTAQTAASVPTVDVAPVDDVALDCENTPQGPEDQSEGEIVDSEGDPEDAGVPILENLKMSEEEQRDYDNFSLASVTAPKRPWRAQGDSKFLSPQPQN